MPRKLQTRSWVQVNPFSRAYAKPVENRGNPVIGQHASKLADQLVSRGFGLPAILTAAVFDHFEARVVSALPVEHQATVGRSRR